MSRFVLFTLMSCTPLASGHRVQQGHGGRRLTGHVFAALAPPGIATD